MPIPNRNDIQGAPGPYPSYALREPITSYSGSQLGATSDHKIYRACVLYILS